MKYNLIVTNIIKGINLNRDFSVIKHSDSSRDLELSAVVMLKLVIPDAYVSDPEIESDNKEETQKFTPVGLGLEHLRLQQPLSQRANLDHNTIIHTLSSSKLNLEIHLS
ncbi:hypothetical protein RF11_10224 [Thelohanellus kitauei]|uniref:Uncharacterized protein n=1 Tax=Thelohanellus kitauei TaxID=669202 RepID=A0A0C2MWN6_THEKT|nr:hypothetical protein RF11_10224 [Thelohanellus kitauei]